MDRSYRQRLLLPLLVVTLPLPLFGQSTLTVPGQYATIQGAIGAAASGDTVSVSPGTYFETLDFLGKDLTVTSVGGPAATVIDAAGVGTVVTFVSGEGPGAELRGFTVTGGVGASGEPGAVYCRASSPTLRDCHFIANVGGESEAGGIACVSDAAPSVFGCTFEANTGGDGGPNPWKNGGAGAIQCRSASVLVEDCQFVANLGGIPSVSPSDVYGGPGCIQGHSGSTLITVRRCTFTDNEGGAAGAATHSFGGCGVLRTNSSAVLVVEQSTFHQNRGGHALANGGYGGAGVVAKSSNSTVEFRECSFTENVGGDGPPVSHGYGGDGALTARGGCHANHCLPPGFTVSDCTIRGNQGGYGWSEPGGGAVGCSSGSPMLVERTTISGNTGGSSNRTSSVEGGAGAFHCTSSGAPVVVDSVIEGNQGGAAKGDGGVGVVLATSSAAPAFLRCRIRDNRGATGTGTMGGYRAGGGVLFASSNGGARFESCLIDGNRGGNGVTAPGGAGAFFVEGSGRVAVINTVVARNIGGDSGGRGGDGGATLNGSGMPFVTNSTFTQNRGGVSATGQFSLQGVGGIRMSTGRVANSIVWGNESARPAADILTNVSSFAPGVKYSCLGQDIAGDGNFSADPRFVDPANGDYHLDCQSPCIDAGAISVLELPSVDFEGDLRLYGAAVDIGADETTHGPIGVPGCVAAINSTGVGSHLFATGGESVDDRCFSLRAEDVTGTGVFVYGNGLIQVPFGDGVRCVGGQTHSLPPSRPQNGRLFREIDPQGIPGPLTPGSTWHFQAWYRDTASGGAQFNLSDSVSIQFAP